MGYSKKDEKELWNLLTQLDNLVSKETLRKNEIIEIKKFLSVMSDIKLSAHPTITNHLEQLKKTTQNSLDILKEYSLDYHVDQETFDCFNNIVDNIQVAQDALSLLQENLAVFDRRRAYKKILEKNNIKQNNIADTICKLTNSTDASQDSTRTEINKILNCDENRKGYSTKDNENEQSEQPSFWDLMILGLYFFKHKKLDEKSSINNPIEIYNEYIKDAVTFFISEWAELLPIHDADSSPKTTPNRKFIMAKLLYNDGIEDVIYNLFNVKSKSRKPK